MNQMQQVNLATAILLVAMLACAARALASPMASSNLNQNEDEAADQDEDDGQASSMAASRHGRNQEADNEFGTSFTGSTGGYGDAAQQPRYNQQNNRSPYSGNNPNSRAAHEKQQQLQQLQHQAEASENNENQADDDDADEDSSADFEGPTIETNRGSRATARAWAESTQPWLESSAQFSPEGIVPVDGGELEGAIGADSNIANAKIEMSPQDRATAAGHHHHHGHYASGWLKMGAETGKKGAFKWHDKHPVGGKGRR